MALYKKNVVKNHFGPFTIYNIAFRSFNISKFYLWRKKLFFLLFSSSFEKRERKLSDSSDGKKKSQLKLI